MIRNLKVLGLALMAVFALSAVVAAAASAQQGKITSDGPVTLIGDETGAATANALLVAFGSEIMCPGSTLTGHKVLTLAETEAGKKHELIPNLSTTATITPHYKNCHTFIPATKTMTVTMNGCDYVLHVGVTTAPLNTGTYSLTADIVCPVGKVIEVHVYNSTDHTKEVLCTLKVTPAVGLTGEAGQPMPHVTNTAGGHFDITGTFAGIVVHREGVCLLDGKGAETKNATFRVDQTVTGKNSLGGVTAVSVTD
jgi:hypothetical protein